MNRGHRGIRSVRKILAAFQLERIFLKGCCQDFVDGAGRGNRTLVLLLAAYKILLAPYLLFRLEIAHQVPAVTLLRTKHMLYIVKRS